VLKGTKTTQGSHPSVGAAAALLQQRPKVGGRSLGVMWKHPPCSQRWSPAVLCEGKNDTCPPN